MRGRFGAWPLVAFAAAVVLAYAIPVQEVGCNESAHYALVQQLDRGTPNIDAIHGETCDLSYIRGHYYAAKAPGLAQTSLPIYAVLRAAGAVPKDPDAAGTWPHAMNFIPRRAIWQVHLWSVLLPALLLLVLLRAVSERLEPGSGNAVATATGLGTLLLPFATDFFSHVLSAALGFAAFWLAFRARRDRELVLAGVLGGFGVVVEFPMAFVAGLVGLYVVRAAPRARRAALYAGGAAFGVLPLLLYNLWAFGSVTDLSYKNAVIDAGKSGHDVVGANASGFFGVGMPHPHVGFELLLSPKGLLVLSPVLALVPVGLLMLARRHRAEALLAGAVCAAFVVWNCGYYLPFGGIVPGPRFLVPALPFAALGLVPVARRLPGAFVALTLVSVAVMAGVTITEPLLASDDTTLWLRYFRDGHFTDTVATLVAGAHGWAAALPFLVAIVVAAAAGLAGVGSRLARPELARALAALFAWWLVCHAAPELLHRDAAAGGWWGALAAAVLVAACVPIVARPLSAALLSVAPLTAVLVPALTNRPKIVLLLGVAALGLGLAFVRSRRSALPRLWPV